MLLMTHLDGFYTWKMGLMVLLDQPWIWTRQDVYSSGVLNMVSCLPLCTPVLLWACEATCLIGQPLSCDDGPVRSLMRALFRIE